MINDKLSESITPKIEAAKKETRIGINQAVQVRK